MADADPQRRGFSAQTVCQPACKGRCGKLRQIRRQCPLLAVCCNRRAADIIAILKSRKNFLCICHFPLLMQNFTILFLLLYIAVSASATPSCGFAARGNYTARSARPQSSAPHRKLPAPRACPRPENMPQTRRSPAPATG